MPPKRRRPGQCVCASKAPLAKRSRVTDKVIKKVVEKESTKKRKSKKGEKLNNDDVTQKKDVTQKTESSKMMSAYGDQKSLSTFLIDSGWKSTLCVEFEAEYFKKLDQQLQKEYSESPGEVFPSKENIFNAFNMTPFDKVKLVILGQDPYHDVGQAHGLSFSVPMGVNPPPSLKNIFKELENDIVGFKAPAHGCLEKWAKQGVLLLNAALTVRAHEPNSHAKIGWQTFTDAAITAISSKLSRKCVFILWGGFAQKKERLINSTKHVVIKTAHPSPLSATKFFGCKCFSEANKALQLSGQTVIDWSL